MYKIRDKGELKLFATKEEAQNYFEWKVKKYSKESILIRIEKWNGFIIMNTGEKIVYNKRLKGKVLDFDVNWWILQKNASAVRI